MVELVRGSGRCVRRAFGRWTMGLALVFSIAAALPTGASDPEKPDLGCGYQSPEAVRAAVQAAVEAGQIADPGIRALPVVRPRHAIGGVAAAGVPRMTPDDITFFEDTAGLLVGTFSNGQLFNLMGRATNAVLAQRGDNFDFVAFWVNFAPSRQIGAAFYLGLENNVSGLGQGLFNDRAAMGIAGTNTEGWVMMWNVRSWGPGFADRTQLVFGQEFEHRFGMFLNAIPGGRRFQGDDGNCGRSAHWNFKVDAQGSGMEVSEWTGAPTAFRVPGSIGFNTDIPGGVHSYPDLYLMGYVSPLELDTLPSELRYMDNASICASPYSGPISPWTSGDIVATNGVRSPSSVTSQKDFRTAWVLIHQPSTPPTQSQLDHVVHMLNDWSDVYALSTLNRGTMNNTVGVPFSMDFPVGRPDVLLPGTATPVTVGTTDLVGRPNAVSGLLHVSASGGVFSVAPLTSSGVNLFTGTIPATSCPGVVEYFVTMDSTSGVTIRRPSGPGTNFTAFVAGTSGTVFADDFETDKGWTVTNGAGLTAGTWARGVPLGGGVRGDPQTDFDGSGRAYLTDPGAGNTDVDGGSTTLTSPAIDLSGVPEAILRYARWFTNDAGGGAGEDAWVAEITDNGVTWVTLENTKVSTGWAEETFRVGDFVFLTNQVRVRFTATDVGAGSVVEAGVDKFRITAVSCAVGSCSPADAPLAEPNAVAKNRYLAFVGSPSVAQTAIQVKFVDLPAPHDVWNGTTMWVGPPQGVSQGGGSVTPITGVSNIKTAPLQCAPLFANWSAVGPVQVFHEGIVPDGRYELRAVSSLCDPGVAGDFSAPLVLQQSRWGDVSGVFDPSSGTWLPPDGSVDVTADVVAMLDKFAGRAGAPAKTRVDIEPATPDRIIDILDLTGALDAFRGLPFPFVPGTTPCP